MTDTILAVDLGKFNSVLCLYELGSHDATVCAVPSRSWPCKSESVSGAAAVDGHQGLIATAART